MKPLNPADLKQYFSSPDYQNRRKGRKQILKFARGKAVSTERKGVLFQSKAAHRFGRAVRLYLDRRAKLSEQLREKPDQPPTQPVFLKRSMKVVECDDCQTFVNQSGLTRVGKVQQGEVVLLEAVLNNDFTSASEALEKLCTIFKDNFGESWVKDYDQYLSKLDLELEGMVAAYSKGSFWQRILGKHKKYKKVVYRARDIMHNHRNQQIDKTGWDPQKKRVLKPSPARTYHQHLQAHKPVEAKPATERKIETAPATEMQVKETAPAIQKEVTTAFARLCKQYPELQSEDLNLVVSILDQNDRLADGVLRPNAYRAMFDIELFGHIVKQKSGQPLSLQPSQVSLHKQLQPVPVAPAVESPPVTLAQEVPAPESSEQNRVMGGLLQQINSIEPEEEAAFDQPLTEDICAHGVQGATLEAELKRVDAEIDQLQSEMAGIPGIAIDLQKQRINNRILQRYRFGKISYQKALSQLSQGKAPDQRRDIKVSLDSTTPVRQTLLTAGEKKELALYREAVNYLHTHQRHGDSNCQSFANAMEVFCRGRGYNQVLGVREQLEVPRIGQTAPIAVWNHPDWSRKNTTEFLPDLCFHPDTHESMPDAFPQAVKRSTNAYNPHGEENLLQLNGERYTLLKTAKTGAAGHYLFVVRARSTGRFIAIDGQSRQVYPLLHADGTMTDEARDKIDGRNIYTFRTDNIPDEVYMAELEKTNDLLRQS